MTETMTMNGMTNTEHRVFHSMGIPVHLTMVGVSLHDADEMAREAERIFSEYDLRFSRFKEESELMALNNSHGAWHKVSIELYQVLKKCVALSAETDGAFDPSVGGILASYGYGLPLHFQLKDNVPTYRDLAFNNRELLVRLAPGQVLEPACIVKGIAIDSAGKALAKAPGFMINAGGDILTKGPFENNTPWNIAIQDPRNAGAIVTAVGIQNVGMATSGTYQTRGEKDGKRWHHLVNMKTGGSPSHTMSATVIARTCEEADTEASLAILLPLADALKRLESRELAYFLISENGSVSKNSVFASLEVPMSSIIK